MPPDAAGRDDDIEDYSDATSTFGDRLGLAREAVGLTQAELAERLGVKVQTLQNWEEDRSEPRANKLQMLAGLVNASMVWLMTGEGEPPAPMGDRPRSGAAQECIAEFRRLRTDQARLAARMARLEKRLAAALGAP